MPDLFEKGSSTRCDLCGDNLGDGEALDRHAGRHNGADPQTFKIRHMPEKKFRPHPENCNCAECNEIRQMIKDQKKAHWDSLTQQRAA